MTGTWKQIASIPSLLGTLNLDPYKMIKGNLRDGTGIHFSLDWWISDDVLQRKFPLLFDLEKNKACFVSARLHSGQLIIGFNWGWHRAISAVNEQQQFAELLILLSGSAITAGADLWATQIGGSGFFSVGSVKKCIVEATCAVPEEVYDWCNWVPRKVSIVAWLAFLDRLPTVEALARRNIFVDTPFCRLCDNNVESVEHLFTGCPIAMEVWQAVFSWCQVPNVFIFHVWNLLRYHKIAKTSARAKKAFYAVVVTTFWSLWKARNDLIHNQTAVVVRNIFEEVIQSDLLSPDFHQSDIHQIFCINGESTDELIQRYVKLYWEMVRLKITKTNEEWVNKLANVLPGDSWRTFLSDLKKIYFNLNLSVFIEKIKERELELQKNSNAETDEAKCKSEEIVREVEEQVKEISAIKVETKAEAICNQGRR
ncbi:uncharacterized protein LOC110932975 [Helianthus annuus]|uniref:uncharacterized protein LOC110932975 n=1 Tax=Helianthus annuus TaxID=4232 RepID=UPI000B8F18F9|nr:uncharacterized protein LOC110932975 [Helianthus annuus]